MRTAPVTNRNGLTAADIDRLLPKQGSRRGHASLSRSERAQRILTTLLATSGPVLLVVPGTDNGSYDNGNREAVRAVLARHRGPMVVASIPYPAVFPPWPGSLPDGEAVLEQVLDGLRQHAPGRPVWVLGESQGALVVANVLSRPRYAAAVTRAAVLALSPMTGLFLAAASAVEGAVRVLPSSKFIRFGHVDDVIASTPPNFGNLVDGRFWQMLGGLVAGKEFSYDPHDYRGDGEVVARFLLTGTPPTAAERRHPRSTHAA